MALDREGGKNMANNIIYFEAQTGIIRDQPSAVSSFYQYAIQVRHRVELEEAIAAATPGSTRVAVRPDSCAAWTTGRSEAKGQRTYYVEGFGLIDEADLWRFIPNFSQYLTLAGTEQWQDMQIGDTFEGTAFNKPVGLTRRS
jgi:hypothetical protein